MKHWHQAMLYAWACLLDFVIIVFTLGICRPAFALLYAGLLAQKDLQKMNEKLEESYKASKLYSEEIIPEYFNKENQDV